MPETKIKKNWFLRHKILTVVGIVILIGIVVGAASGDKSTTNTNPNNNSSSKQKTEVKNEVAKIGTPVTDGKFEFTVKSIECGKASVGTNQYLTKEAQGQFCLLNVTVKNTGDAAQSLFSSNQKLLNSKDQQYSADDTATMYASSDGSGSWYNDINPGNSVEGTIVFDLPKDQTPLTAELHDSAFSSGVKISLE